MQPIRKTPKCLSSARGPKFPLHAVLDPGEVMYPIPHLKNKYITNKGRVLTRRGSTLKVMTAQTDRPSIGPYVGIKVDGLTRRFPVESLKQFVTSTL